MKKSFRYAILFLTCIFGVALFSFQPLYSSFADDCTFFASPCEGGVHIYGVSEQAIVDGTLVIPSTVDNQPVLSIGRKTGSMEDSCIPLYDSKIKYLDLSQAVNLVTIGKNCFNKSECALEGSLYLPASLTSIENGAFSKSKISNLYIPDSDSCITLGNPCFDSVEHFFFQSQQTLDKYRVAENWNTYADKMQLLVTDKVIDIHFDYIQSSIQKAVGKPFNFSLIESSWQEDSNFAFPTPHKDMFDFVGWSIDGTIVSETDIVPDLDCVTLSPVWAERSHNITYICDFPTDSCAVSFNESQGYVLPQIQSNDISYSWDGWYLDENCSQKIYEIEPGTNCDIVLYSKKHARNMSISFLLEKYTFLYNEDIDLNIQLSNVPDNFQTTTTFFIYQNRWNQLHSNTVSQLQPGTYNIRAEVVVSHNSQSVTLKKDTAIQISKHKVSVVWDDSYSFTFSNSVISPSISATCQTLPDSFIILTEKFDSEQWIECQMFDVGTYRISIVPLYDYVEISGTSSKQYIISPLPIDLGYLSPYSSIQYGQSLIPQISTYSLSCGFKQEYVQEQIFVKKNNSWYDYSHRTLDEPVSKLKQISSIGKYEYRLSSTQQNYMLSGMYIKFVLDVTPQPLTVSWGSVNFEYDGNQHIPSATATNSAGLDIPLIVSGAMVQANSQDIPTYTAEASLLDSGYVLTNPTTSFNISKTSAYIDVSYTYSKFYDGLPIQISAVVKDPSGTIFADNVTRFCITDLTSVGTHTVRLVWDGDSNHFPATTLEFCVCIKTENISYGDYDSPKLTVQSSDGFNSLSDVIINEQNLDTINLNTESYNSITSLYNVQNIYSLKSDNTLNVSLNMSIPQGVSNVSDLKVFRVNNDGSIEEVQYTISQGHIQILSSKTNSTYMLVLEKNTKTTTIYIILAVSVSCACLLLLCLIATLRRKHSSKHLV